MIRAWLMAITERIHQGIGKFLNDALDEIHLAEMADEDTETQEPGLCPTWFPETSSVDNGWPAAPNRGRS